MIAAYHLKEQENRLKQYSAKDDIERIDKNIIEVLNKAKRKIEGPARNIQFLEKKWRAYLLYLKYKIK